MSSLHDRLFSSYGIPSLFATYVDREVPVVVLLKDEPVGTFYAVVQEVRRQVRFDDAGNRVQEHTASLVFTRDDTHWWGGLAETQDNYVFQAMGYLWAVDSFEGVGVYTTDTTIEVPVKRLRQQGKSYAEHRQT